MSTGLATAVPGGAAAEEQALTRSAAARRQRLAAIDVGTNSIHMIVVEARRHGYRVIDKEKAMVQLGLGSLEGRPMTEDAIERGVGALTNMSAIARRWNVQEIIAVATSAVREAPNRRRFLNAVAKSAGIAVRIISGEEEADYIYRAIRAAVDFHGGTAVCIDIGGGSVELIVGTEHEVFLTHSQPLGALRLAERFLPHDPPRSREIDECRRHVRKALRKTFGRVNSLGFDFAIGTSGTILTLAALGAESGMEGSEAPASGLRWLSRSRLSDLVGEMGDMTIQERSERFRIDQRRAATILAGGIVLEQIMKGFDVEQLRACDAALREGIVERALDTEREGRQAAGGIRRAAVLELAERSNIDRQHANNVARLALRIFDQTQELHMLRMGERELLEYAALLHEIGTHVSYQGHHKHTYYLISHAGLRGFTADQIAIIANVARYYRKATPTEEHLGFSELSASQQGIVEKLAAILRLAEGLDRGRRGAVRDAGIEIGPRTMTLSIRCRRDCDIEIAAATKRARYFGRVFKRRTSIEVH